MSNLSCVKVHRAEPEAVHGRVRRVAAAGGGEAAGPRRAGEGRRAPPGSLLDHNPLCSDPDPDPASHIVIGIRIRTGSEYIRIQLKLLKFS